MVDVGVQYLEPNIEPKEHHTVCVGVQDLEPKEPSMLTYYKKRRKWNQYVCRGSKRDENEISMCVGVQDIEPKEPSLVMVQNFEPLQY